jgi:LDH2 family malate/lactate/ureidoglycolate dehydrogenase
MAKTYYISIEQATEWGVRLLQKCNIDETQARTAMKVLITANLRGTDTHGIVMLQHYTRRFVRIETRPVSVISENGCNTLIDGGNSLGTYASVIAMEKAIEKAEKFGAGVSSVRNSSHYGAAAYYALMAAQKDMIGISTTNAAARLAPWGGIDEFIGNNPFAISVPSGKYPITLDMANSVVAFQKIAAYAREGLTLPEGWSMDNKGEPTTDAQAALNGILMPVGGYKGVGLAVMIDLLCGALSQNGFSDGIPHYADYDKPRQVGHFFIAVKISDFLDINTFKASVDGYVEKFHTLRKKEGVDRLFVPGEIEYENSVERTKNGFPLSDAVVDQLNAVSDEFGVPRLQ